MVVGSVNLDLVRRVARLPAPGETLLASASSRGLGGKGANQAVAAARSGAPTTLLAAVGEDTEGRLLCDELAAAGVDVGLVRSAPRPTGTAVVVVDSAGENAIVVDPGANQLMSGLRPEELRCLATAAVVVAQLEVPLDTVEVALQHARRNGALTVLNAAPAAPLPPSLLAAVDVLLVNETEAEELSDGRDPEQAAVHLAAQVPAVIVTLGAAGALVAEGGALTTVPGIDARQVVDTTGAGDAFCGAFAAARAAGLDTVAAVRRACVAGAMAVEVAGAASSSPTLDQLVARERDGAP